MNVNIKGIDMNRFIKYVGIVAARDMALCSSLGVTKIKNKIVRTDKGEMFVIKGYIVEDGDDVYIVCKEVCWIENSVLFGGVIYKREPPECQAKCINYMLSHNVGVNKTVRIRTRGLHARQVYHTRINTIIDANGEITHAFH